MIRGSKAPVPQGWGRTESSLGVNVTRPKNKAMANSDVNFELDKDQSMDEIDDEEMRYATETPDDYALVSGDFTPDAQGFIGGYHKNDLMDQLSIMRNENKMTDSDLSSILNEIESQKVNSDQMDPRGRESNRFLEYSIRQGLGR